MIPPVLDVRTERIPDPGSLIEWLDPLHPTAFLRNGDGIATFGERLRFAQDGDERVAALALRWRELCEAAVVDDEVRMPGTGLIALGSFAFTDVSATSSVLTIPAVVIGRRDGVAWMTRIGVDGGDAGTPAEPRPLGEDYHAALGPGSMAPEDYVEAVRNAVRRLDGGGVGKVVLARDLVGDIPPTADRRRILDRLARAYPDTFTFAVDGLMGASPETLVRVTKGTVSARVLAGTAARGTDAATDASAETAIAASAKDRAEHDFALRSVLTALEPHTSALEADPEPFVLRLPNLFHLASDVTGVLADDATALDLVAALHPTAAVAGTPTDAAVELIAELEPFDRGRYAGPVGWVDAHGDGEWAIALRCAHVDEHGHVTAWAGAGIVADSDPHHELAETTLKFRPIADALA